MTVNVIYFTIYDKLMVSRNLKIRGNNFLIESDWKKIKRASARALPAAIDKMLKMALAPPGDRIEALKVRYLVK